MTARPMLRALLLLVTLAAPAVAAADPPIEIRLGTLAPARSPWYRMLEDMRQEWARASGGRVVLRILTPVGGERSLVDKMRVQTLHAVAVSGVGMPAIDRGISALHTPLLFRTYEELDYVRDRIAPKLEASLAAKGVVVLNWSDVGWVYFFSRAPVRTPADLRPMRIYTSAGDAETETLFKTAGFTPQPLEPSDLLSGLQTGMVDAFDVPPLFALLNQSFALAPHMLDLRWGVLTGATIVDARAWARVPPDLRQPLLDASRRSAARYRAEIRKLGDDAVVEMQRQKLQLHAVDERTREAWQREVEKVHPKIRGGIVPADLFDDVLRLVAEYRHAATR